MNKFKKVAPLILASLVAASALMAACDDDGEDRPEVTVIEDGGSGSGSGSASGSVSGSGSGSASGAGVEPGIVEDPPEGATEVSVTLEEWAVTPDSESAAAGEIYFLVENAGPKDPHEFVVIKTDLGPADLTTTDGKVPEEEVDLIDEIEPFAPASSASIVLNLEAGNYALICNIAEEEEGELESHYELGMSAAFTVE
jgi:uncharacterized cupredoxin-like copper-binding protein